MNSVGWGRCPPDSKLVYAAGPIHGSLICPPFVSVALEEIPPLIAFVEVRLNEWVFRTSAHRTLCAVGDAFANRLNGDSRGAQYAIFQSLGHDDFLVILQGTDYQYFNRALFAIRSLLVDDIPMEDRFDLPEGISGANHVVQDTYTVYGFLSTPLEHSLSMTCRTSSERTQVSPSTFVKVFPGHEGVLRDIEGTYSTARVTARLQPGIFDGRVDYAPLDPSKGFTQAEALQAVLDVYTRLRDRGRNHVQHFHTDWGRPVEPSLQSPSSHGRTGSPFYELSDEDLRKVAAFDGTKLALQTIETYDSFARLPGAGHHLVDVSHFFREFVPAFLHDAAGTINKASLVGLERLLESLVMICLERMVGATQGRQPQLRFDSFGGLQKLNVAASEVARLVGACVESVDDRAISLCSLSFVGQGRRREWRSTVTTGTQKPKRFAVHEITFGGSLRDCLGSLFHEVGHSVSFDVDGIDVVRDVLLPDTARILTNGFLAGTPDGYPLMATARRVRLLVAESAGQEVSIYRFVKKTLSNDLEEALVSGQGLGFLNVMSSSVGYLTQLLLRCRRFCGGGEGEGVSGEETIQLEEVARGVHTFIVAWRRVMHEARADIVAATIAGAPVVVEKDGRLYLGRADSSATDGEWYVATVPKHQTKEMATLLRAVYDSAGPIQRRPVIDGFVETQLYLTRYASTVRRVLRPHWGGLLAPVAELVQAIRDSTDPIPSEAVSPILDLWSSALQRRVGVT